MTEERGMLTGSSVVLWFRRWFAVTCRGVVMLSVLLVGRPVWHILMLLVVLHEVLFDGIVVCGRAYAYRVGPLFCEALLQVLVWVLVALAVLCASGVPIPACSQLECLTGPGSRCALPHVDSTGRIVHMGVLALVVELRHL